MTHEDWERIEVGDFLVDHRGRRRKVHEVNRVQKKANMRRTRTIALVDGAYPPPNDRRIHVWSTDGNSKNWRLEKANAAT